MKFGYVNVTRIYSSDECPSYIQAINKHTFRKVGQYFIEEYEIFVPDPHDYTDTIKYRCGEFEDIIVTVKK